MLKLSPICSAVVLALSTLTIAGCSDAPEAPQTKTPAKQASTSKADIYQDYLNRDVRDDIFYFVLPDRFENGDPTNDQGSQTDPISRGGFDPTHKGYFHGGDLQGLKNRLDYLQDMGITAIWLTPILRNRAMQGPSAGYHGYWVVDFTELDPHFGSNDDLKDLIDTAHSKGMKVFFDIITNHTADVIKYKECHYPDGSHRNTETYLCDYKYMEQLAQGDTYTPFIVEGEENLKVPAWLNDPKYYNNQGDSKWHGESAVNGDFMGLDDLNTRMPEVVDGFIDIYKNIITNFKPDGFRIDTVKHVDMSFWQKFSPAIMQHAKEQGIPNFHVFGEVYDGDPAFLSRFTTIGKMPAILDFGLQGNADAVFANTESPQKLEQLFDDDDYYRDADSSPDQLLTFIANHDMGRIGLFLNNNFPDSSEAEKTQRSILTHAFMYFARGIPVVYYGDEQGFTGDGNDQAAREDMMPSVTASYNDNNLLGTDKTTADDNFDQTHPIYLKLAEFADIYKTHAALRKGIHLTRHADEEPGIYAFSRIERSEQQEYLLVFNSSTEQKKVVLDASSKQYQPLYGAKLPLKAQNGSVTVNVPALGFVIYKANDRINPVIASDIKVVTAEVDKRSPDFINIEYDLSGITQQPSLYKVTTEFVNHQGVYQMGATDFTPPYRAKILASDIKGGVNGQVRVTIDNLNGDVQQKEISLKL
ncbi:alpha amylase [Catenovulum agarivorans DS-2]|uniref:Alpha-amylase n=1 Tax=Catenovulum agarivorans DS-2 TaxID=1328313 RepID=W7QGV1_9ALTE|nr:alpha-amylase family glycosyl hydrolase [Catenovulum agarivorans]EWH08167.1 alpha amylase [Catenovulum agarivorans DS-2]